MTNPAVWGVASCGDCRASSVLAQRTGDPIVVSLSLARRLRGGAGSAEEAIKSKIRSREKQEGTAAEKARGPFIGRERKKVKDDTHRKKKIKMKKQKEPETAPAENIPAMTSSWMEGEELFALPGVPCRPLSACESMFEHPSLVDKDLDDFPHLPIHEVDQEVAPTTVDPANLVGIERLKHGLQGFCAGPSPELLEDLRRQGEPGPWNSSDPEELKRPWRPYSELWIPGHETFKYYKNGSYTGEKMDQKTKQHWARLANIYAPMMVGVPQLFIDDNAERVGTLDWSVIKDRPRTSLDPLLKSTYRYAPDTGYTSLWRDGLFPHENVPIDREGNPLCDPWEYEFRNTSRDSLEGDAAGGSRGWGVRAEREGSAAIQRRRLALSPATVAVDMMRTKFKGMLRDAENVPAPRIHPSQLLLMILQSAWLESQEEEVTAEMVFEFLCNKNSELAMWPQLA